MTYLQIAVEGGIPALIVYLMFFRCGFKNLKVMRKARISTSTQFCSWVPCTAR